MKKMGRIEIEDSEPSQATLWAYVLTGIPLWDEGKVNELIKTMRRADAEMYRCTACKKKFPFKRPPDLCPSCNAIHPFVLAEPLNRREKKVA